MRKGTWKIIATVAAVGLWSLSGVTQAAIIDCKVVTKNYMSVDSSQVSACIEAGVGNIGNGQNDDFLSTAAGAGYTDIGDGTINSGAGGPSGTWSFNSALWTNPGAPLAIGFKFGTGNTPDEWFIYTLVNNVSSGSFLFNCTLCNGNGTGGLSHISIYSSGGTTSTGNTSTGNTSTGNTSTGNTSSGQVPEPGTLGLLGLGLLGLGYARRLSKLK